MIFVGLGDGETLWLPGPGGWCRHWGRFCVCSWGISFSMGVKIMDLSVAPGVQLARDAMCQTRWRAKNRPSEPKPNPHYANCAPFHRDWTSSLCRKGQLTGMAIPSLLMLLRRSSLIFTGSSLYNCTCVNITWFQVVVDKLKQDTRVTVLGHVQVCLATLSFMTYDM